jgi:hypothetical protein
MTNRSYSLEYLLLCPLADSETNPFQASKSSVSEMGSEC